MSRSRRSAVAVAVAVVLVATACSGSEDESSTVEVEVSVDVCVHDDCFVAPVPFASVVLVGAEPERITTDDDGLATFPVTGSGTYTVRARWHGLSAESASVSTSVGGTTEITLRLLPTITMS